MSDEPTMPEEVWLRRTHLDGKHFSAVRSESRLVKDRTPYILKSTVDVQRAEDSNTIRGLESDLEMSDESIRLSREHLKKAGISAAFFDDCAALAAKKILDQQETIRELADCLSNLINEVVDASYSDNNCLDPENDYVVDAKKALKNTRIAEIELSLGVKDGIKKDGA